MPKSALETWTVEASAIPALQAALKLPIPVMRGEATDLANFVVRNWKADKEPKTGAVRRPGLEMIGDRLPATTATDLLSQSQALGEAQDAYLLAAGMKAVNPEPRARYVLGELAAAAEFHFDDGVEDDDDARLGAVQASHSGYPDTSDAVAQELEDYSALLKPHARELDGMGGFDAALIPEAITLASALRDKPATPVGAGDPKVRSALLLRNQMAALLLRTMGKVRSAARFVFRDHPEIIREATSAYERRKRAAARRNKQKATEGKPQPGGLE